MKSQEKELSLESEADFPCLSPGPSMRPGKAKSRSSKGTSLEDFPNPNSPWQNTPRPGKSPALLSLAFPISRVRRLIKSEGDIQWVGVEAGFLIAKAADLFLEKFVEDAFEKMAVENRCSLQYKDLAFQVSNLERYEFIADFVPGKVTAESVLAGNPPSE